MTTFLPQEVQDGLDAARKRALKRASRLAIEDRSGRYRVLRAWQGGFAMDAKTAPALRGLVDLYDGARHLSQCLIVASEQDADELRFEYKRMTEATDRQPLDFYQAPDAPAALLQAPGAG